MSVSQADAEPLHASDANCLQSQQPTWEDCNSAFSPCDWWLESCSSQQACRTALIMLKSKGKRDMYSYGVLAELERVLDKT